jgi:hypothetical protein
MRLSGRENHILTLIHSVTVTIMEPFRYKVLYRTFF